MLWLEIKRITNNRYIRGLVDAAFIKKPFELSSCVIILHGASCSGKSTLLRRLRRRHTGAQFIEADDFRYTERIEDQLSLVKEARRSLSQSGVDAKEVELLIQTINEFAALPGLRYPPYKTMIGLIKACAESDVVVTTCGNLPPPNWSGEYYARLKEATGKSVLHVLLAPTKEVHRQRAEARGLGGQFAERYQGQIWRLETKVFYDIVLSGSEDIVKIVEMIRESSFERGLATSLTR